MTIVWNTEYSDLLYIATRDSLAPIIKSQTKIVEKPILVIAKDNSKSVKENINDSLYRIVENLDDFEVYKYSFSEKIINGFSQNREGLGEWW